MLYTEKHVSKTNLRDPTKYVIFVLKLYQNQLVFHHFLYCFINVLLCLTKNVCSKFHLMQRWMDFIQTSSINLLIEESPIVGKLHVKTMHYGNEYLKLDFIFYCCAYQINNVCVCP